MSFICGKWLSPLGINKVFSSKVSGLNFSKTVLSSSFSSTPRTRPRQRALLPDAARHALTIDSSRLQTDVHERKTSVSASARLEHKGAAVARLHRRRPPLRVLGAPRWCTAAVLVLTACGLWYEVGGLYLWKHQTCCGRLGEQRAESPANA